VILAVRQNWVAETDFVFFWSTHNRMLRSYDKVLCVRLGLVFNTRSWYLCPTEEEKLAGGLPKYPIGTILLGGKTVT